MKQEIHGARMFGLAAKSGANVLITGPTGSGKSVLAKRIHEQSGRKSKNFVSVNLATLHEGTFESELFGHERGAFTGADSRRVGRLEFAQGGTVFLDEVGELSPRLQARLLDFLQSRTVVPVGSNREVKLDVRVIAATHRDLPKAVTRGEFREDLFHRLRVIPLELASLSERSEDFDTLLHQCLEEACQSAGRSVLRISEEVAHRLENYSWPGNLRELRNVLEYVALASDGPEIQIGDLPPWFGKENAESKIPADSPALGVAEFPMTLDYYENLARFEREYLERALKRFRGRVNLTARRLGVSKSTLIRRLKAYQLGSWTPQN